MLSNLPLFIEFIIVPPQILYPTHHDIHRQSSLTINRLFWRRRRPHSPQVKEEGRCRLEIAYLEVFVVAVAGCYFFRFFLITYYSESVFLIRILDGQVPWNHGVRFLARDKGHGVAAGDRPKRILLTHQTIPSPHRLRYFPNLIHIQLLLLLKLIRRIHQRPLHCPIPHSKKLFLLHFERTDELLRLDLSDLGCQTLRCLHFLVYLLGYVYGVIFFLRLALLHYKNVIFRLSIQWCLAWCRDQTRF